MKTFNKPRSDLKHWFGLLLRNRLRVLRPRPDEQGAPGMGYSPFLLVKNLAAAVKNPAYAPGAHLHVTFAVKRLSFWQRVLLPVLSIPFYAGAPGFISKVYFVNPEAHAFGGWYTWETKEDAGRYIESYAGEFMRRNALPGTLAFDIIPVLE